MVVRDMTRDSFTPITLDNLDQSITLFSQGCCKIGKTTQACRSAEGDSPVPEREVSSLHPSFPPPQAAKREFATAMFVLTIAGDYP